jgi:hypothetical protein
MKRILFLVVPCLAAELFSCGTSPVASTGGSASDVGFVQGSVYRQDNSPASNTQVLLVPVRHNPVASQSDSAVLFDTTDNMGGYKFRVANPGLYNIEAVQLFERTRLFIAGLEVRKNDTTPAPAGFLKAAGTITVVIADSVRPASGFVYMAGTTFSAAFSGTGPAITMDSIPAGLFSTVLFGSAARPESSSVAARNVSVAPNDTVRTANFRVLYVAKDTELVKRDTLFMQRLESRGIAMVIRADALLSSADTANINVIFFASTISGPATSLMRVWKKPVIACETVLFNAMDLCGPQTGVDFGNIPDSINDISIVAPSHPLAAGFSGTVTVVNQALALPWCTPAASATVVSTIPNQPTQATIFCYEAGAPLYDAAPAPDRRVGMLLKMEVALNLNENGWKLFDAAVNWCLGLQ